MAPMKENIFNIWYIFLTSSRVLLWALDKFSSSVKASFPLPPLINQHIFSLYVVI